jgi:peptide/nickel transport system substrate-binding protein
MTLSKSPTAHWRSLRSIAATAIAAATLSLAAPHTLAQNLSIGLSSDANAMDPHFHLITTNANIGEHVFDTLIHKDEKQRLKSGLAISWKAINESTWEFKLRQNVKFHDGSPFTADDVVFSLDRPATVKNSPGPYTVYTKAIVGKEVVDAHTLRIKTATAYPLLPNEIATIMVVSKKVAATATTEDFNSGKAMVGTGPYKFVRWAKGDRTELERNDQYWGKKATWPKVTFRVLTNDAARVAALLSGNVDAIEAVPTPDQPKLRTNTKFTSFQVGSNRLMYLHVDSNRDKSPHVFDNNGKPLEKNPLKDLNVRRAISKAISRIAIKERVMEGSGTPTGQLMPEGFFGHNPAIKWDDYDPEGAKKLLAQAGYPDGFQLTLHGPNDRYPNDDQMCQAIAQMLSRIGIKTKVETMPASVYFGRANRLEFSLMLVGWSADTGEASSPLKALLATFDRDKGLGTANRGRYSNPKVDAELAAALTEIDEKRREARLQSATKFAMDDLGLIPIQHNVNVWAARKGVTYVPRTDERTYAFEFGKQ